MQIPVGSMALEIPFHDATRLYFCFAVKGSLGSVCAGGGFSSVFLFFALPPPSLPFWVLFAHPIVLKIAEKLFLIHSTLAVSNALIIVIIRWATLHLNEAFSSQIASFWYFCCWSDDDHFWHLVHLSPQHFTRLKTSWLFLLVSLQSIIIDPTFFSRPLKKKKRKWIRIKRRKTVLSV